MTLTGPTNLKEGIAGDEDIAGGLVEFEAIALLVPHYQSQNGKRRLLPEDAFLVE